MDYNDFTDNYKTGWVSIFRSIRTHWIWKDPIKLKWWIDILLEVNHKGKKVNIGNEIFDCQKGQSIMSLKNWADRWNVSKDSTRNFFKLLQKDNMVELENLRKTTRLTVCNYGIYQDVLHDSQTQTKRKPNANQTQTHPNNNVNNVNNGNKYIRRFTPPTIEEVKNYCIERNNDVSPDKFINHYTSNGWMVGKNKMKDWKAAIRTWEKSNFSNNDSNKTSIAVSNFSNVTPEDLKF